MASISATTCSPATGACACTCACTRVHACAHRLQPAELHLVSIHAPNDYPYVAPDAPWAMCAEPGAGWARYEPLLRAALASRPAECDVLVLSLGFDTLEGDPCAAEGHRLALQPDDFGAMRRVLAEPGLPLLVVQEGGYLMEKIAAAASAFWTGAGTG